MAQVRQVLKAVSVESAKAKRKCHHSRGKHGVAKGEKCLAIVEPAGSRKNYCVKCGNEILDVATKDIDAMRTTLNF
jgi:hypothetical protein